MLLYRAIRKYGPDQFEWDEVCSDVPDEDLNRKEIECIAWFGTKAPNGYNLTDGGGGRIGFVVSDETRTRLRVSHLGKISAMKGRKHKPESLAKIRETLNHPEMRKKRSEIAKKQWGTLERRAKQTIAMRGNRNGVGNLGWIKTIEKRRARRDAGGVY